MPYPNVSYIDGFAAVVATSAYCYNNATTYVATDSSYSQTGVHTEVRNANGQKTGSTTWGDARNGTLNMTYDQASDADPGEDKLMQVGFVLSWANRIWIVTDVSNDVVASGTVSFSVSIEEAQNPVITNLLSLLGQQKYQTLASGSLPTTVSGAATNVRENATVVYTIENYDTGEAAPTGFTINSSTGLITIANTAAVATHDIRVIAADTVSPVGEDSNTIKGFGRLTFKVT